MLGLYFRTTLQLRLILDIKRSVLGGPCSTVASIGDCGSPDRGSIPLKGLFILKTSKVSNYRNKTGQINSFKIYRIY